MIIHFQRFGVPLHYSLRQLAPCHLRFVTQSARKGSLELEYQEYCPHFGKKH
ncbi:hypothetical protein [Coleofasciculus chthonoplastes]|uniref:hypothetical protein n=1 Tax=Coleofasciculus chthonoplastes TaxID=64178 RepID=UPI004062B9FE